MSKESTREVFLLLYRSRLKQVIGLYKMSFFILFDKVTLFYLIPFSLVALLVVRQYVFGHINYVLLSILHNYPLLCCTVFAFLFLLSTGISSIISPRFKLTNSDYLILTLPVNMELILRWNIKREQFKRLILLVIFLSIFTFIFNLFSLLTYVFIIITFVIVDLFAGLFQWKTFQQHGKQRLFSLFVYFTSVLIFGLMVIFFYKIKFPVPIVIFYIIEMLIVQFLSFIWLKGKLMGSVEWGKTVWYGEEKTWNRLVVKLITGTGFKSNKFWISKKTVKEKRIKYQLVKVLTHYWKEHCLQNKVFLINMVTNTAAIWGYLVIRNHAIDFAYSISSIIMLYFLISVFKDSLNTYQFRVLPWPKREYVRSFLFFSFWPIILLLGLNFISLIWLSKFILLKCLLIVFGVGTYTFSYLILLLNDSFLSFGNKGKLLKLKQVLYIIFYVGLCYLSTFYPFINIAIILIVAISLLLYKRLLIVRYKF
jgi:hypothetical protein